MARRRFLNTEGYRVIRFWNNVLMLNIDGVIAETARNLPPKLRSSAA